METKAREALPCHVKIVEHWLDKAITPTGEVVAESRDSWDREAEPVVWDVYQPRCWACGKIVDDEVMPEDPSWRTVYGRPKTRSKLNRCHIVPHMLGGSDKDCGNLFLLCKKCHEQSPDTEDPENFLRWVYKKRQHVHDTDYGHDITEMMEEVIEECKLLGKDPYSGDITKACKVGNHGQSVSQSSIVMAYVGTCKDIQENE